MLWLALQLPHLALDRLLRSGEAYRDPLAIADDHQIVEHNRSAARAGVERGMAVSTAQALCGPLRILLRDPAGERAALESLAAWAGQFTPLVTLQPPRGLLLEVGASRRLFGGEAALRTELLEGVERLGYRSRAATAPTPLGAWLLLRAGRTLHCTESAELHAALAALPLSVLEISGSTLTALHGFGLRRIADLNAISRASLARRVGPELLHYLDRAFGRIPDPRPPFAPPERFRSHLPLPAEVAQREALSFPLRRLLQELSGFLRGRGAGVQEVTLHLGHPGRPATPLTAGLVRPGRDSDHLFALLRERLEQSPLPAPVDALTLCADRLHRLPPDAAALFAEKRESGAAWQPLVERLHARLGDGAVQWLHLQSDHRPERAFRLTAEPPDNRQQALNRAYRQSAGPLPLALLETPEPLPLRAGRPWREGPLRLLGERVRIEAGWWEGCDTGRDYFIALHPSGARLWIFRRHPDRQWFLHGLFR